MATENDDDARDNGLGEATAIAETKTERPEKAEHESKEAAPEKERKPKDIRASIKAAIKEHAELNEKARKAAPKDSATDEHAPKAETDKKASPAGDTAIPKTEKTVGTESTAASQAQSAETAPASLSKEIKARWAELPPEVRSEFLRREADTAKGVEQLKQRYQPIESALAPIRDELRTLGKTEAEGVQMLVDWRRALSGPNKVHAFRILAQAEGVDLNQLVQPSQRQAQAQPEAAEILRPYIDPLNQKVTYLETELQRRDHEAVARDINAMAKDKPHFEKVRVAMGHLINAGIARGENPTEVFNDAYERACRQDPEIFAAIQQEEIAKREAKAKADAEKAAKAEAERKRVEAENVAKARKAAVSPRSGSPAGMAIANKNSGKSVGDSLRQAIKEVRATSAI
jgi:hypothetical protein